jgi:hypothetical protein
MTALKRKNDKLSTGFISGFLLPLGMLFLFYVGKYSEVDPIVFLKNLWQLKILIKILSLCAFPNLVLFLYYYRKKLDLAARGVIMATLLYAMLALIYTIVS